LEVCRSYVSLLCEKVGDGVDIHGGRDVKGINLRGGLKEKSRPPQYNRKNEIV
jgi:hypothetical protein